MLLLIVSIYQFELASRMPHRDFQHQSVATVVGLKGIENGGELVGIKLDYNQNISLSSMTVMTAFEEVICRIPSTTAPMT